MTTILVDHDIEGQAALLWQTLQDQGWPALFPLSFVTLADVGLSEDSTDREVWGFVQARQMLLLTNNRSMKDELRSNRRCETP